MTKTAEESARQKLGDGRVICPTCTATLETYLDGSLCTAQLDEKCPGFVAVEEAMKTIAQVTLEADRSRIPMWVLYSHVSDMPKPFVTRLHYSLPHSQGTIYHDMADNIEELRGQFRALGLTCIPRDASDDPVIVESWLL